MRALGILIFLSLVIGATIAWEWMWRMENGALDAGAALSPSGQYLAQARMLSEGSVVPYGQGVFVRHRYIPLWSTSTLVFAAYCQPEMRVEWRSAKEIVVECVVSEETPKLLPTPDGIVVIHNGGGS